MRYILTTPYATRIVGIDRQRFNEYAASGDYACAPETTQGKPREFNENDLIALFTFARELDGGMRPAAAGRIAAEIRKALFVDPDAMAVAIACRMDDMALAHVETDSAAAQDGGTFSTTIYNVVAVRELMRERWAVAREELLRDTARKLDGETGEQVD